MKRNKRIIFTLMTLMMFSGIFVSCSGSDVSDQIENIVDSENENVLAVKNGSPKAYPDITYDEAFSKFFSYPTWNYFNGTQEGPDDDGDGKPDYVKENIDVVEFTGRCLYRDVEAKALIQFVLDNEEGTFEAAYLSFNELPQSNIVLYALLEKIFESYADSNGISMKETKTSSEEIETSAEEIETSVEEIETSVEETKTSVEETETSIEEIVSTHGFEEDMGSVGEETQNVIEEQLQMNDELILANLELSGVYSNITEGGICTINMYSSPDDESVGKIDVNTNGIIFSGALIPYDVGEFEAIASDGSTMYVRFLYAEETYIMELLTYDQNFVGSFIMTEHFQS